MNAPFTIGAPTDDAATIRELREALQFYAGAADMDLAQYSERITEDAGATAEAALARTEPR